MPTNLPSLGPISVSPSLHRLVRLELISQQVSKWCNDAEVASTELATNLLEDINRRLGTNFVPAKVESHHGNADDFTALRSVVEKPKYHFHYDEHVVVTGKHTHYFRLDPTVPGCPAHDWGNSNRENRAALVRIERRSTDPRAFFISGESHHSAHRDVAAAKSSQITPGNRDRCGPRSGDDYDAFCELCSASKSRCRFGNSL